MMTIEASLRYDIQFIQLLRWIDFRNLHLQFSQKFEAGGQKIEQQALCTRSRIWHRSSAYTHRVLIVRQRSWAYQLIQQLDMQQFLFPSNFCLANTFEALRGILQAQSVENRSCRQQKKEVTFQQIWMLKLYLIFRYYIKQIKSIFYYLIISILICCNIYSFNQLVIVQITQRPTQDSFTCYQRINWPHKIGMGLIQGRQIETIRPTDIKLLFLFKIIIQYLISLPNIIFCIQTVSMDRTNYSSKPKYVSQQLVNPQPQIKNKTKNLMLCLILKRLACDALRSGINKLKRSAEQNVGKINRMQKISSINSEICKLFAWHRIKSYVSNKKAKNRIVKDAFILGKQLQKQYLRQSFIRIRAKGDQNKNQIYLKMIELKKSIMARSLRNIYIKNKVVGWTNLKYNMLAERQKRRITSINTLMKGIQKRNIVYAWLRLNFYKVKQNNALKHQVKDLEHQIQDMKIQIENKNTNICRLKEELQQIKNNSSIRQVQQNNSLINNSFGNKSCSNLNRSRNKYSNTDKDSNNGSMIKDRSYGSLLGISYLSGRSRESNAGSKAEQCACQSCNFKQKYQKYKASYQTLKKQLQIIKTQLEFTKDMNEHMQNEIKASFSNDEKEKKLQRLKNQLKQCQKDRQALRQKVLKYQKYVSKLKLQFKAKIQQIYRRVKKST